MVKRLLTLVFGLLLGLAQPALATPHGDAQLIANILVTSPDFRAKLHEMGVKACADKLSSLLAARSVKIKDRDKLVSLLAVNGVFSFANPIVRKKLILDLRAGNP